jgi:hypothetical protein
MSLLSSSSNISKVPEEDKYQEGDLVRVIGPYKALNVWPPNQDYLNQVGKVEMIKRASKRGLVKWETWVRFPDNKVIMFATGYKYTDSSLRPVFRI